VAPKIAKPTQHEKPRRFGRDSYPASGPENSLADFGRLSLKSVALSLAIGDPSHELGILSVKYLIGSILSYRVDDPTKLDFDERNTGHFDIMDGHGQASRYTCF
jgi:hypothetical protein